MFMLVSYENGVGSLYYISLISIMGRTHYRQLSLIFVAPIYFVFT